MHARATIRPHLIAIRLRRWWLISRHPSVNPACPPPRARKNFWRLCRKYPEVAAQLGLTELSVFDPLLRLT
jgi:hypothetical protein